jgi:hypothetical protein
MGKTRFASEAAKRLRSDEVLFLVGVGGGFLGVDHGGVVFAFLAAGPQGVFELLVPGVEFGL